VKQIADTDAIFGDKQSKHLSWIIWPWRWKHHSPPRVGKYSPDCTA